MSVRVKVAGGPDAGHNSPKWQEKTPAKRATENRKPIGAKYGREFPRYPNGKLRDQCLRFITVRQAELEHKNV